MSSMTTSFSSSSSSISDAVPASSRTTSTTGVSSANTDGQGKGPTTIYSIEQAPPFTATSSFPYAAPGVNATPSTTHSSSLTSTSAISSFTDPAASALASAKAFGVPSNELTACEVNGSVPDAGPFCSPDQHQGLWVGYKYAVTWNPALFPLNATAHVQLRYTNQSAGNVTWTSDPIPSYKGVVDVEMEKEWLAGVPGNDSSSGQNLTLWMISEPLGGQNITKSGPQLSLIVNPKSLPPVLIRPVPSKYGLEIGLPIGLAALIIIVVSICCAMRRQTRHLQSIRGVSKDYMARRARRRHQTGDIDLDDYHESKEDKGYSDQGAYNPSNQISGNHFRDEVARQRAEDDISLRRFPSSF